MMCCSTVMMCGFIGKFPSQESGKTTVSRGNSQRERMRERRFYHEGTKKKLRQGRLLLRGLDVVIESK